MKNWERVSLDKNIYIDEGLEEIIRIIQKGEKQYCYDYTWEKLESISKVKKIIYF